MKKSALILGLLSLLILSCSNEQTTINTSAAKELSDTCTGSDRFTCITMQVLLLVKENPKALKPLFKSFSILIKDGTLTDDPRLFSPLIHEVGMELAFNKIPPETAFDYCPLNFKAGCLHGVVMEYLDEVDSNDTLTLAAFCDFAEVDPTLYKNCIHGVGHELTAKTQGPLNEIVTQCKVLDATLLSACASGVFMEYSTGVSGTGEHAHKQSIGSIILPCEEVDSEFQATCYSSLAAYRQYLPSTEAFEETLITCQTVPAKHQDACLLGLAEKIYTAEAQDLKAAQTNCESLPSFQTQCKDALDQIKALESFL